MFGKIVPSPSERACPELVEGGLSKGLLGRGEVPAGSGYAIFINIVIASL